MSTGEVYTVVIRGGSNPFSYISGESCNATFTVDWQRVLPYKYNKFLLKATFRSRPSNSYTINDDCFVFVECSAFPRNYFYDTLTDSSGYCVAVASIYPSIDTDTRFFHESIKDAPRITVNYPQQSQFTVKLTDIEGNVLSSAKYAEWVLILELQPIKDSVSG